MQYVHLGQSGLEVSRICLGTLNFGTSLPLAQGVSFDVDA